MEINRENKETRYVCILIVVNDVRKEESTHVVRRLREDFLKAGKLVSLLICYTQSTLKLVRFSYVFD